MHTFLVSLPRVNARTNNPRLPLSQPPAPARPSNRIRKHKSRRGSRWSSGSRNKAAGAFSASGDSRDRGPVAVADELRPARAEESRATWPPGGREKINRRGEGAGPLRPTARRGHLFGGPRRAGANGPAGSARVSLTSRARTRGQPAY